MAMAEKLNLVKGFVFLNKQNKDKEIMNFKKSTEKE